MLSGCYVQVEHILDEVTATQVDSCQKHTPPEKVEKRLFELSKILREICRCVLRAAPSASPAVGVLSQLWLAVVYYVDSLVTGNSRMVQEATTNYKEELERKKLEMQQRVRQIMFQAE